jgi:transcriptional regulator with XRE-family HTH domain
MLAEARRERRWSLREAARRANVTPGTIVHLEKARRVPSDVVAEDIIDGYRLSTAEADMLRAASVPDVGKSSPRKARRL